MKIKPETVWNETYRDTQVAGHCGAALSVFSALHATSGPILRVKIDTYSAGIKLSVDADLTVEQAEAMAAELLIAANKKRRHDAAWADYQAEQLKEAA
jgi:hypothetical protein